MWHWLMGTVQQFKWYVCGSCWTIYLKLRWFSFDSHVASYHLTKPIVWACAYPRYVSAERNSTENLIKYWHPSRTHEHGWEHPCILPILSSTQSVLVRKSFHSSPCRALLMWGPQMPQTTMVWRRKAPKVVRKLRQHRQTLMPIASCHHFDWKSYQHMTILLLQAQHLFRLPVYKHFGSKHTKNKNKQQTMHAT